MASPIIFKITNAGKNAMLDAQNNGITLRLTHVAIGTGKYAPTGNEIALAGELQRWVITNGGIEPATHTVRFSSSMTASQELTAYEIGVFTDTGVLFAVVSNTAKPLVKIYPDITFIASFGLALDDFDVSKITVSQDNKGALSIALMQQHLASPDPHPQYLNEARFQLLLRTLIPYGYLYHTHDTTNPKPWFDELMGIETWWRRLTGKIITATDPNDPYIKDVGMVLGQKGMTDLAISQRPNVYPLQTTHIFERYDPSKVIETVWAVTSSKNSVAEGAALSFTISANNIPDGQILPWVVKEGKLNAQSNDVTTPDNTANGTVTIKNGTATVNYTTTAFDNMPEPQKHVRLTVGAPANLSINVPISDTGHTETVLHISQSTYNGIVLDKYYKQQSGSYPSSTDTVRFIVDSGVDIVAPDTTRGAIESGANWPTGSQIIVENHGRILGRGGNGGRSAFMYSVVDNDEVVNVTQAESGKDGGTAILGAKNISVENYGFIAGGGGGGGGQGLFQYNSKYNVIGGGGTGGGAPFGKASINEATYSMYKIDPTVTNKAIIPDNSKLYDVLSSQHNFLILYIHGIWQSDQFPAVATNNISNRMVTIELNPEGTAYKTDFSGDRSYQLNLKADGGAGQMREVIAYMSTSGTLEAGGLGGSNIVGVPAWQAYVLKNGTPKNLYINKGGDGGGVGENGRAGISTERFGLGFVQNQSINHPSAQGGLAGYIYQGSVTINNFSGGTTKGRTA